MGNNIYSAALSGMNAAQFGMATTQHNIANANTPGYTRQQMNVDSKAPVATGSGFVGQGVNVSNVQRLSDAYLTSQVRQEQAQASYLNTFLSSMTMIDNMVSDPAAGVSTALQGFFNATNDLANYPDSATARQSVLSNAQIVAGRFQTIDQRLTDISNNLTGQISSSVQMVNAYATQIAALNGTIKRAISVGQGQMPNDLMDQRDQLISKLNQEVKVSVTQQSDGSTNVFVGNGLALVLDEKTMGMQVVKSSVDPSKVEVSYLATTGKSVSIQQNALQGGNIGAYLTFRDQNLDPVRNGLGRIALGFANSVNQQNQLGQDQNGSLGGSLLVAATPKVDQGINNTGTAGITAAISNVAALTTSDYQLKFDGANYSMVRLSDNVVTNLGASLVPSPTVDGFTVNLASGAMAAGDSFVIKPTSTGASTIALTTNDPAKVAAAAPMRTITPLSNIGTGIISAGSVNGPAPINANVQSPVSLTFTSATTFTVTGAVPAVVGNVAFTPGQNISYNGWTVQISGAPATGDSFNIAANTNAMGDSRNALQLAGLQSQNLMLNGTASLQGVYSQLVGQIGAKTQEIMVMSTAQDSMVAQVVNAQQSVSGVNLDEEAANLLRYQRAYQAAAKAMQIANTMFDQLLTLGR